MILCLDVGNTQIFGGVFCGVQLQLRFRYATRSGSSSDELGIFLKSVLRENNIDTTAIAQIAICSVVPHIDYSLQSACKKYFSITPFVLKAGAKTGLHIKYRNPLEVGADRIANAIAAVHLYPNQPLIVIDFGTATTFCAISDKREYLGGVIHAGMRLSMQALSDNTAKLASVPIIKPQCVVGRSTMESMQSGLYYSQVATIAAITQQITQECFPQRKPIILGTGGFATLFSETSLFSVILPDLVLQGLCLAVHLNAAELR